MDIYQWRRERGEPKNKSPHLPQPREATTVSVQWHGALTPIVIEPIQVLNTTYYAFRPVGAPEASAFIVAEDASRGDDFGDNKHCDAFGFRDDGVLRPFSPYYERSYQGIGDLMRSIERGWYGRLDLRIGEHQSSYNSIFYGSTGRLIKEYRNDSLTIGMIMIPGPYQLRESDYDPPLQTPPWCDSSEAPALLARLDNQQLAVYLAQQQADASTAAGFARAWPGWSHAERRSWLPPLEREIEDELTRLMKWIYWSAPQFVRPKDFPLTPQRKQQWIRPRFVVETEGMGEYFFDARMFGPGVGEKIQLLEDRLKAIWPHIERAFAAERARLQTQRDALPPSAAHWCYRRGCYNVTFGSPTAHEQIESRVALREWLWRYAGADLETIERDL